MRSEYELRIDGKKVRRFATSAREAANRELQAARQAAVGTNSQVELVEVPWTVPAHLRGY